MPCGSAFALGRSVRALYNILIATQICLPLECCLSHAIKLAYSQACTSCCLQLKYIQRWRVVILCSTACLYWFVPLVQHYTDTAGTSWKQECYLSTRSQHAHQSLLTYANNTSASTDLSKVAAVINSRWPAWSQNACRRVSQVCTIPTNCNILSLKAAAKISCVQTHGGGQVVGPTPAEAAALLHDIAVKCQSLPAFTRLSLVCHHMHMQNDWI